MPSNVLLLHVSAWDCGGLTCLDEDAVAGVEVEAEAEASNAPLNRALRSCSRRFWVLNGGEGLRVGDLLRKGLMLLLYSLFLLFLLVDGGMKKSTSTSTKSPLSLGVCPSYGTVYE